MERGTQLLEPTGLEIHDSLICLGDGGPNECCSVKATDYTQATTAGVPVEVASLASVAYPLKRGRSKGEAHVRTVYTEGSTEE